MLNDNPNVAVRSERITMGIMVFIIGMGSVLVVAGLLSIARRRGVK